MRIIQNKTHAVCSKNKTSMPATVSARNISKIHAARKYVFWRIAPDPLKNEQFAKKPRN